MCRTMALDARTRSSLYGKFAEMLGDHDANALMSEFPSVEADELVTKQFLRAELGELRSELRAEIAQLRSELSGKIAEVRSELRGEMGELRGEMVSLRSDLRTEMIDRFHRQTVWLAGTVVASAGVVIAAVPLLS
jgi:predicted  nucleic acid-binding Zn-ribbon protein